VVLPSVKLAPPIAESVPVLPNVQLVTVNLVWTPYTIGLDSSRLLMVLVNPVPMLTLLTVQVLLLPFNASHSIP